MYGLYHEHLLTFSRVKLHVHVCDNGEQLYTLYEGKLMALVLDLNNYLFYLASLSYTDISQSIHCRISGWLIIGNDR